MTVPFSNRHPAAGSLRCYSGESRPLRSRLPGSRLQNSAAELREYAARRSWQIVTEYAEQVSGAKRHRAELDRLLRNARQGKFEMVLCLKLDRFGRSLVHCVTSIEQLQELGVRFIATSQGLDSGADISKFSGETKLEVYI